MQKKKVENNLFNITRLVQGIGVEDLIELSSISHGGNNRAWLLKTKQKKIFIKKYFISEHDKRDRFGTEISFLIFAWEKGIREIPEPLAADRANLLGLFAFISGRRPEKEEINRPFLEYALSFLRKLNLNKNSLRSQSLFCGSESCFNLAEHIESLGKKLNRLKSITDNDRLDGEAHKFIEDELNAKWLEVKSGIYREISEKGFDLNETIDPNDRIISPSDFGFHNTILTAEGELFFVDFEYAGWDDPVKLICDFFCQPELPVPIEYFDWFVEEISKITGRSSDDNDNLHWRAKLLFPLYKLKWCCIMLNDFVPVDRERKDFASFDTDRRKIQLDKAVHYLKGIHCGIY